ncbi:MAG: hypothetical protein Aurels2KO_20070 [Aureliella sp.]
MNEAVQLKSNQYSVANILYLMTCAAAIIAYAKAIGESATFQLVVYIVAAICFGGLIGFFRRSWSNGMFWATLTNLLVFLAVAGGRLPSEAVTIAWGIVGGVCGALCGVELPARVVWRGVSMCVVAPVVMVCSLRVLSQAIEGLVWFDVVCTAPIGVVLCLGIAFLQRFESESGHPRYAMAAWLSACVLLGNVLVPIIGGVQR